MTDYWTYTMDFIGVGEVTYSINPSNVSLKHVYRRHPDWEGIIIRELEGSINLHNEYFDYALDSFENYGYCNLTIYKAGSVWLNVKVTEIVDIDYNQKVLTLKKFSVNSNANKFINFCKKEFIIPAGNTDIYYILTKITENGSKLLDVIDTVFTNLGIYESFTPSSVWYDSTKIDLNKFYITNNSYIYDGSAAKLGGQLKKCTLERLFKFLEYTLNIYVSIESNAVKFRNNDELADNLLDLTGQLEHMHQVSYNKDVFIQRQYFRFSDNNNSGGGDDEDYNDVELTYNYIDGELEMNLQDFTTRANPSITAGEYDTDGWFVGYINTGTGGLEGETGYVSGNTQQNGRLCPANLMDEYYRNYIFTNRDYFNIAGNAATDLPLEYKPIIQIPDIPTILDDPATFYEGILIEKNIDDPTHRRVAIVYEQSTDLTNNITTFKSYEYRNTI